MTENKIHRNIGLRQKVADYSQNPEAVMALFAEQDAQLDADLLKAQETHAETKAAVLSGLTELIARTIGLGEPGLLSGKRYSAKANSELYARAPYLFDRFSKKPFDGATSLVECRKWLADEELDESLAGVYQMFAASLRNIVYMEEWSAAEEKLAALLLEIQSEITEE